MKIDWEITEWCEDLEGCWAVALEGTDKYGNGYTASGYAVQDGSVGGEITDVFDVEPEDDWATRHQRELAYNNHNYHYLLGALSSEVRWMEDSVTRKILIKTLKHIGEWDQLCDQFNLDKETGRKVI